jgi:hypothetical protein
MKNKINPPAIPSLSQKQVCGRVNRENPKAYSAAPTARAIWL